MKKIFSFILAGAWLAGDYFSKIWAVKTLSVGGIVINDYMNLVLAFNKGSAFSFLSDAGGWQMWLFAGLAALVSLWLVYALIFEDIDGLTRFGYASILGGALGNLYDRLMYKQVIDFIQWHYKQHSWPVFNVADVAITLGVMAIILAVILSAKNSTTALG